MDSGKKAKWVEALRSGKFTQAHNSVGSVRMKHLCCLGVGAVICEPQTRHYDLPTTSEALDILSRFGFDSFRPDHEYSDAAKALINMNDVDRKDFSAIADYIEATL